MDTSKIFCERYMTVSQAAVCMNCEHKNNCESFAEVTTL